MIAPITILTDNNQCGESLRWWRNGWHYYTFNKGNRSANFMGEAFNPRYEDRQAVGCKANASDVAAGLRGLLFSTDIYVYKEDWQLCNIADGSMSVSDGINGIEAEITVLT